MRYHYRYNAGWGSVVAASGDIAVDIIRSSVPSVTLIQFRATTLWEKKNEEGAKAKQGNRSGVRKRGLPKSKSDVPSATGQCGKNLTEFAPD